MDDVFSTAFNVLTVVNSTILNSDYVFPVDSVTDFDVAAVSTDSLKMTSSWGIHAINGKFLHTTRLTLSFFLTLMF